jgi:hypothetical protein
MRRLALLAVPLVVTLLPLQGVSAQTTLDFEDRAGQAQLPADYAGLTWGGRWYHSSSTSFSTLYGYSRGASSGSMFLYNGFADFVSISGASVFDFNGAYLGVGHDQELFLTLVGYRGSVEVYREVLTLSATQHDFYTLDFLDVDRVTFDSRRADGNISHFTMDDVRLDYPATPTEVVPEPITMVLLGSGLIGVGGAARRRRREAPSDESLDG